MKQAVPRITFILLHLLVQYKPPGYQPSAFPAIVVAPTVVETCIVPASDGSELGNKCPQTIEPKIVIVITTTHVMVNLCVRGQWIWTIMAGAADVPMGIKW